MLRRRNAFREDIRDSSLSSTSDEEPTPAGFDLRRFHSGGRSIFQRDGSVERAQQGRRAPERPLLHRSRLRTAADNNYIAMSRQGANREGRRVHSSLDSYHLNRERIYCGTNCGQSGYFNACGGCDGRCGPNNGCCCRACNELDEETVRRFEMIGRNVNNDGAKVHVSYNTSTRNNHRAGYVFYCGRSVGRQNYHNYCGGCDGDCGPSNGCQCKACHELDELYKQTKTSGSVQSAYDRQRKAILDRMPV